MSIGIKAQAFFISKISGQFKDPSHGKLNASALDK